MLASQSHIVFASRRHQVHLYTSSEKSEEVKDYSQGGTHLTVINDYNEITDGLQNAVHSYSDIDITTEGGRGEALDVFFEPHETSDLNRSFLGGLDRSDYASDSSVEPQSSHGLSDLQISKFLNEKIFSGSDKRPADFVPVGFGFRIALPKANYGPTDFSPVAIP